ALAIGTKLLPLIFLPLLIRRLGIGKSILYFTIAGATLLLLFAPFLSFQSISNYLSSLALYFQVLEFNASIYYVVRWLGHQIANDGFIAMSGVILPIISFIAIIALTLGERVVNWPSLFARMLLCLTVYFLFTSNVHPWYLTTMVMLSVFTSYKYMLPWSLLMILTYATYQTLPYSENLWFVAIEYLVTGGWLAYEMRGKLFKTSGINRALQEELP
ncbi:mannosyltransferase, partial [Chloroflexota bacterium]